MSFEERKGIYQQTSAELTEFGTEEIIVPESFENNEYTITKESEITSIFKKIFRDKLLLRFKSPQTNFLNNNRITMIKGKYIKVSNPFILFAEGAFPEQIECNFENDGIDYSFKLDKYKSNGIEQEIYCPIPDSIKVLKRRGSYRTKATKNIPVGIYSNEQSKEYIGTLNDISELGIGIKFDSCYFDIDFYNSLKQKQDPRVPIIIEVDGKYISVVISIKFLNKNEKEEIIIGAEFILTEESKNNDLKEMLNNIREEATFQKKKEISQYLIFKGQIGVY